MEATLQDSLFGSEARAAPGTKPKGQILKWVGNKFRYAEIISKQLLPMTGRYIEPFVGTGAVLATVAPDDAIAGDAMELLIDLHRQVQRDSTELVAHYAEARIELLDRGRTAYEAVKKRFNQTPTPADLLVLSRACYGGVVRFTKSGHFSTPMGPHTPMPADKLAIYMCDWQSRIANVEFVCRDFVETMAEAKHGDIIYCDPPYRHGQRILYGSQDFRLQDLWAASESARRSRAKVAVSIDGWRRSGDKKIDLGIPDGLFERELIIERGGCMLRRFQMEGQDMAFEQVADRLLLSW